MSSPKFERVKQRHPTLAALLDRLLDHVVRQIGEGPGYVVPKLAAADLRLSDGEAFILLELLAEGGVLRRVYNVYCRKENTLLATVTSLDALDEIGRCDFCDAEHDPSQLKVEIAFQNADGGLEDLAA
jgi:hypothetical protein